MEMTPALPFVVQEIETGHMKLLRTVQEARAFAEEFVDLLGDDFRVWDSQGHEVIFGEGFVMGHGDLPQLGPEQRQELAALIDSSLQGKPDDANELWSFRRKLEG